MKCKCTCNLAGRHSGLWADSVNVQVYGSGVFHGKKSQVEGHSRTTVGMGCLYREVGIWVGKNLFNLINNENTCPIDNLIFWSHNILLWLQIQEKSQNSKISHLYFFKVDQLFLYISQHLLSCLYTHINNIPWPPTWSWSKRLCLYRDAARGLYYISFFLLLSERS